MLTIDLSPFQVAAAKIQGFRLDQMPFALSKSLNASVKEGQKVLSEQTWPSHIGARNKQFARFALRQKYSTKKSLRAELSDEHMGNRVGILTRQADGGVKTAKKGALALPSKDVKARRGAKGVPKNLKPRGLTNAFRKGDVIYQRTGRKGRALKLRYTLKRSAKTPKRVPLREDFERTVRAEFRRQFPLQMREAMRSAFRK